MFNFQTNQIADFCLQYNKQTQTHVHTAPTYKHICTYAINVCTFLYVMYMHLYIHIFKYIYMHNVATTKNL